MSSGRGLEMRAPTLQLAGYRLEVQRQYGVF